MFKVFTGQAPFKGTDLQEVLEAIASKQPPFLRDLAVGIPEDLQAICLSCLAWNPEDRPSAMDVATDLGRYLAGENVRLKPKLYGDVLRQRISEFSTTASSWESQGMISTEEKDSLEVTNRWILAEEDHWLFDARKITLVETMVYTGAWLAVVAVLQMVWIQTDPVPAPWRWLFPALTTLVLFCGGLVAHKRSNPSIAAAFLAGSAITISPCLNAMLSELHWLATPHLFIKQLSSDGPFTNQQVCVSTWAALVISVIGLNRLKMSCFAWTAGILTATTYTMSLITAGWLGWDSISRQAYSFLPLALLIPIALSLENRGKVRWTLPFYLVGGASLIGSLDTLASQSYQFECLGIPIGTENSFLNAYRARSFSFVMNGIFFLLAMLLTHRGPSLDLRRISKLCEVLAIGHILTPLGLSAYEHKGAPYRWWDAGLYVGFAILFVLIAPIRSRCKILVGGLLGCGIGSYLLIEMNLVRTDRFLLMLCSVGLVLALSTYIWTECRAKAKAGS